MIYRLEKGERLTHQELDDNFRELSDRQLVLETGNGSIIDVSAVWVEDLDFYVVANNYPVNNTFYASTAGTVTLDAADATNDRIDLIVAVAPVSPATVGTVSKITGTAAASPAPPDYDPSLVYPIKFVLVKAGATEPSDPNTGEDTTSELIFDEGVEWSFMTPTPTQVAVSTNDAFTGTKSIEFTNITTGTDYLLTSSEVIDGTKISEVEFYIKLKSSFPATGVIYVRWFLNGVSRGNSFYFRNGDFGFSMTATEWQRIVIPFENFGAIGSVNAFQIRPWSAGYAGCYIDKISYVTSSKGTIDKPVVEVDVHSDTITTTTNITNATLTDGGYVQSGKVVGISNGVNAINYTINGEVTTSLVLLGTGAVTFVQGSGRTLVDVYGDGLVLNTQYGTVSIESFGTTDLIYINNV